MPPVFLTSTRPHLQPKSRVDPALRAKLPPPLVEMLASAEFLNSCMQTFDSVDNDKSGEESHASATKLASVLVDAFAFGNHHDNCYDSIKPCPRARVTSETQMKHQTLKRTPRRTRIKASWNHPS